MEEKRFVQISPFPKNVKTWKLIKMQSLQSTLHLTILLSYLIQIPEDPGAQNGAQWKRIFTVSRPFYDFPFYVRPAGTGWVGGGWGRGRGGVGRGRGGQATGALSCPPFCNGLYSCRHLKRGGGVSTRAEPRRSPWYFSTTLLNPGNDKLTAGFREGAFSKGAAYNPSEWPMNPLPVCT